MIIVIDAGHGGIKPGVSDNGLIEKDLNLSLALIVAEKLQAVGFDARLTRTGDEHVTLADRPLMAANVGASFFVSLHHDGSDDPLAHGATVFFQEGVDDSLAWHIHYAMKPIFADGMSDRGIKPENFQVLREATMPAALIEGGFVTNPDDAKKIQTEEYQNLLADCIVSGVQNWVETQVNA